MIVEAHSFNLEYVAEETDILGAYGGVRKKFSHLQESGNKIHEPCAS